MNALRKLHSALLPGGLLLDMQPLGGRIPVEDVAGKVGSLDMREWSRTVCVVSELVDSSLAEGLFAAAGERRYDVRETFADATELLESVASWDGTTLSAALARRVRRATPPLEIVHPVRLRVLRAL